MSKGGLAMRRLLGVIFVFGLLACPAQVLAGSIEVPVPPGFEPPQGPVYRLVGPAAGASRIPRNIQGEWLYGKTVLYTSKTLDAFFVVFTDGAVLHCRRDWDEAGSDSVGFGGEAGWSALAAAGTGGLVNGLVMDLHNIGTADSLFILDWRLRSPSTPIPWGSNFTGPSTGLSPAWPVNHRPRLKIRTGSWARRWPTLATAAATI